MQTLILVFLGVLVGNNAMDGDWATAIISLLVAGAYLREDATREEKKCSR